MKIALPKPSSAAESISTTEILAKLGSVFAEQFELEGEKIRLETRLVADLDLDSLDFAVLGIEIEGKMGVELDENDVRDCETLNDLVDCVAERISKLDD